MYSKINSYPIVVSFVLSTMQFYATFAHLTIKTRFKRQNKNINIELIEIIKYIQSGEDTTNEWSEDNWQFSIRHKIVPHIYYYNPRASLSYYMLYVRKRKRTHRRAYHYSIKIFIIVFSSESQIAGTAIPRQWAPWARRNRLWGELITRNGPREAPTMPYP